MVGKAPFDNPSGNKILSQSVVSFFTFLSMFNSIIIIIIIKY